MTAKAQRETTPLIQMTRITKRFPGILALNAVFLTVHEGEIHSILGENGAGKTTLMNILTGLYAKDEGSLKIKGNSVAFRSPKDALQHGISMIHQFSALIPRLSVFENIILGWEPTIGPFIKPQQSRETIHRIMETTMMPLRLETPVEHLSRGDQQKVEILQALYRGVDILIVDEPVSMLTRHEKAGFLKVLKTMIASGTLSALLFVTHKLEDVMAISDRVTILRRGEVVDVLRANDITKRILAQKLMGKVTRHQVPSRQPCQARKVLEIHQVQTRSETGEVTLQDITFTVCAGEIVGIAGVSGSGQQALMEVLMGIRRAASGSIILQGEEITNQSPTAIRKRGVGYIPEERLQNGILPTLSIQDNILLGTHTQPPFIHPLLHRLGGGLSVFNHDTVKRYATKCITEFAITPPNLKYPAGNLSGGNIQRVILARELARHPLLLLANKPTAGLDLELQQRIQARLITEAEAGTAILLVSEDLDELCLVCHRIAVMRDSRIVAIFSSSEITQEAIIRYMVTNADYGAR